MTRYFICFFMVLAQLVFLVESFAATHDILLDEAQARAKQVEGIQYTLDFKVGPEESFQGKTTIDFTLKSGANAASKSLLIDFTDGKILELKINGDPIVSRESVRDISVGTQKFYDYNDTKIEVATTYFKEGPNQIEIQYSHPYTSTGNGLFKFIDKDGHYYFYSQGEPNYINQVFPCFDQPDLKATYQTTVNAPKDWQVVTNVREPKENNETDKLDKTRRIWSFPRTQKYSSYLFELAFGEYKVWESEVDGIPIRLFARQALAKHVDVDDWLAITKAGLQFYPKAFGVAYPFGKYDQLIVPSFNYGAMENVGAVTFNEGYVSRERPMPNYRIRKSEVILHEMAHMWFGNLVTMKWWDDLWLNEAFATFASFLAIEGARDILKLSDGWQEFFKSEKFAAFRDDALETTHPIVTHATTVAEANANFDSITYYKGASVLKQLYYLLGKEAFLKGLNRYFTTFAFQNSTRQDFINSLVGDSSELKEKLNAWDKEWLQTKGTNAVKVEMTQKNGKIESFKLIQLPDPMDHLLRTHKTQVALFDRTATGALELRETITVEYKGAVTEVPALVGKGAPVLVFPNYGDYDFAQIVLDEESLRTIESSSVVISDSSVRNMIWPTLFTMLRDAQLPAQRFQKIIYNHISDEADINILSSLVQLLSASRRFTAEKLQVQTNQTIETLLYNHLMAAKPKSEEQLVWFKNYIGFVNSTVGLERVRKFLKDEDVPQGITIGQDSRWTIISTLARNGSAEALALIEVEKKRDNSEAGHKAAIAAEVQIPVKSVKEKWAGIILGTAANTDGLNDDEIKAAIRSFHQLGQEKLTRFVEDAYFENLEKLVAASRSPELLQKVAGDMFPSDFDEALVLRADAYLATSPKLSPEVLKALRSTKQLLEKAIKARELSEKVRSYEEEVW